VSRGARIAIVAIAIAAVALAGVFFLRNDRADAPSRATGALPFARTSRAESPFTDFEEARIAIDDECRRVLVASTVVQRVRGLRGVQSLEPYDGMLFVFADDSVSRFTMADTLIPLDITWFDGERRPVGSARMEPCPERDDRDCPAYGADDRYRYALERSSGAGAASMIGPC
jgi:uncharacterized membrane protein (UPF0127 family)